MAAWSDFAGTVAGGAAALAGLLFVGLSLNLSEVLQYSGVPSRPAATLGLTVAILLTAIFVATPGQGRQALSVEMAVIGVATAAMVLVAIRHQRASPHRAQVLPSMMILLVPTLLLVVAAVSFVVSARRRFVLGHRCSDNGFCGGDRQRLGAGRRAQALTPHRFSRQ